MHTIIGLTTLFTAVSVVLLVLLLSIYIRNLKQVKSKLLIGLLLFTVLFLVQNLISLYFFVTMTDYYVRAVETYVFVLSILETIAFSVMLWISWD